MKLNVAEKRKIVNNKINFSSKCTGHRESYFSFLLMECFDRKFTIK